MTPPPAASGTAGRLGRTAAPRLPRRVSGPTPKPRAEAPVSAPQRQTLSLPVPGLLDRLLHGRFLIPVVGVALLGVVFMQVSLLKLNAGIGRDVERIQTLERSNAALATELSRQESGERIDAIAAHLGMVMPQAGGFHYVTVSGADAQRARNRIKPPSPVQPGSTIAAAPVIPVVPAAVAAPAGTATPAAPAPAAAPAAAQAQQQPATGQPTTQTQPAPPATPTGGVAPPAGGDG